jgi:hypothetical protein
VPLEWAPSYCLARKMSSQTKLVYRKTKSKTVGKDTMIKSHCLEKSDNAEFTTILDFLLGMSG